MHEFGGDDFGGRGGGGIKIETSEGNYFSFCLTFYPKNHLFSPKIIHFP